MEERISILSCIFAISEFAFAFLVILFRTESNSSEKLSSNEFFTSFMLTGPFLFEHLIEVVTDLTFASIAEISSASGCGVPTVIPSTSPE